MKTSTLDELGNPSAPPGSHDWTVAVRIDVCIKYREAKTKVGTIRLDLVGLKKHKGWKSVSQRDGSEFLSFEHFCGTKESDGGLGIPPWTIRRIISEKNADMPVAVLKDGPGAPKGNQNAKLTVGALKNNCANSTIVSKGSTSVPYLLARLKRDAPAILARLERGELPSVRQAAIAAGIVKPPTPLQLAKRAVKRMAVNDQNRFFSWLKAEYGI